MLFKNYIPLVYNKSIDCYNTFNLKGFFRLNCQVFIIIIDTIVDKTNNICYNIFTLAFKICLWYNINKIKIVHCYEVLRFNKPLNKISVQIYIAISTTRAQTRRNVFAFHIVQYFWLTDNLLIELTQSQYLIPIYYIGARYIEYTGRQHSKLLFYFFKHRWLVPYLSYN